MRQRAGLAAVLTFIGVMFGFGLRAHADNEHDGSGSGEHEGSAEHHEGSAEHHEGSAEHHEGSAEEHKDAGSAEHHDGSAEEHKDAGSAEHHEGSAAEHHDGSAAEHKDEGASAAEHAAEAAAAVEHEEALKGHEADAHDIELAKEANAGLPSDVDPDYKIDPRDLDDDGVPDDQQEQDPDDPITDPFDEDGDGKLEPEELEDRKEWISDFKDIPNEPDEAALEGRLDGLDPDDPKAENKLLNALAPHITIENFRKLVRIGKKVVLAKMEKKMAHKADKKMRQFSYIIFGVSGAGLFLLLMPLFLRKKYPGQGGTLFKYSALAALVFIVTVNLFGGVLYGYRQVQGALSKYTNPTVAIAAGTFDVLDDHAEDYLTTGKELFGPSIEELRKRPDEQPMVIILENGQKIIKTAKVFLAIKKMVKSIDFLLGMIPTILLLVTLILFILAILPTLKEIIALPAKAAQGNTEAGKEVMGKAAKRVKGELLATLVTIGFLTVLTFISGAVLSRMVFPAVDALLRYFAISVNYLIFQPGSSSGLVFVTLFGVILFLVLNLGALIVSMVMFVGKTQKIFQARFCEDTPLEKHKVFFKWGLPAVLLVQVFPMIFAFIVGPILRAVKNQFYSSDLTDPRAVSWKPLMLAGPLLLVVLFVVLFWAVRALKGIKFLATYKVKPKAPKGAVAPAESVPPQ